MKTRQTTLQRVAQGARQTATVAAGCVALSCAGAPVRPPPPAEPCPPGALEAMKELGIPIGSVYAVSLVFEGSVRRIPVNEGWKLIEPMEDNIGDLESDATLSGRLIIGERVYVRLTEARTAQGKVYPVCMEAWDERGGRGLIREDKGDGPHATVFSTFTVKAVRRFE